MCLGCLLSNMWYKLVFICVFGLKLMLLIFVVSWVGWVLVMIVDEVF